MSTAKERWVAWMKSQVGYHEYGNNMTKYADSQGWDESAYGFSMAGSPWCDFFFDYSMWVNFGFEKGQKMLYQEGKYGGAAVANSALFYRTAGAWYHKPEVGDQAIYAGENHTGGVVEVHSDGTFDCIDGNYSDSVCLRKNLSLSAVSGFGRPNWSIVEDNVEDEENSDIEDDTHCDAPDIADSIISIVDTEEFVKGDLVRVKPDAVWYTGANIASMVYEHSWYVYSSFNDRVILNESEDGTRHIMSPIAAMYLTKVNANTAKTENKLPETVESIEQRENRVAEEIASGDVSMGKYDHHYVYHESDNGNIVITAQQVPTENLIVKIKNIIKKGIIR